jgi:FkbM family methyltransferase
MSKGTFLLRKMKQLGKRFGFDLMNAAEPADVFSALLKYRRKLNTLAREDHAFVQFVLGHYAESRAQLFQDLFVLFSLEQKRGGFFVEFGATDGVELSNTLLLERSHQWKGILAEPAKCWHEDLMKNRRCVIDRRCVWAESGEVLEFNEVSDRGLSTITNYSDQDGHFTSRRMGKTYPVETVSLDDLLASNGAPDRIDYLSVDTEGSELEILRAFDFRKYDIRIITVEHNFTLNRDPIRILLESCGFSRVFESFSMWDDWYRKT